MLGEWLWEQFVPAEEIVVEESEELGKPLQLGCLLSSTAYSHREVGQQGHSLAMFGSVAVAAFKLLLSRPLVCFCLEEGVCSPSELHLVCELVLSLLEVLLWLPEL